MTVKQVGRVCMILLLLSCLFFNGDYIAVYYVVYFQNRRWRYYTNTLDANHS